MIQNPLMTKFTRTAASLCAALFFLAPTGSLAQEQQDAEEALESGTYIAGSHGDWTIRCVGTAPDAATSSDDGDGKGDLQDEEEASAEAAATERPQCVMIQIAVHSDDPELGLSIVVVRQQINDDLVSQMRITTPITVYLPAMVGLEIDGAAIGRLPYEVCSPAGVCVATSFVDGDLEAKLRSGGQAQFFLKDVRGTDGIFNLSLSGFTAAFEQLGAPDS